MKEMSPGLRRAVTFYDPANPAADATSLEAAVADAELVVFDDCAHSPNLERPEPFNRLVLGFLAGERHAGRDGAALAANG